MYFWKDKKNILFCCSIFVISIIIISIYAFFTKYSCYWGDDFWFTRYRENINLLETLSFEKGGHGGGYIGLFLCKLLSFGLPIYLNIHPADFINSGHSIIRGCFLTITLLLVSKFSMFYNRSKLVYIMTFLFLSGWFFYQTLNTYNVIDINYTFYRYVFCFIPFSILWYWIYKNTITKKKTSNKFEYIIVLISAYFVGSASEFISFTSICMAILLIFYNLATGFFQKHDDYNLRINLNSKFYVPICIFSFAFCMFVTSSGFNEVASSRGLSNISITENILKEYIASFFNICIINAWFYWALFFILFIIVFVVAKKQKELNKIIFPLFLPIITLVFMFSLIICGKTFLATDEPSFWLYHNNLIFTYKFLLLFPLLIFFDYCYNYLKKNKIINISLCIVVLAVTSYHFIYFFDHFSIEFMKTVRKEAYQIEKIMRFYHLHNETPIIEQNNYPEIIECLEMDTINDNLFLRSMNLIYKNDDATRLGLIIEENAIEKFYQKGGSFTEQELKELKFERLKDDNFVLNKKEEG